ncbi:MAG: hypothetical protein LBH38_02165 [Holosporales bacterium]|jgi:tyrosine-specific transport protein|nr:hypothetical protein [Holosporales bacterium]
MKKSLSAAFMLAGTAIGSGMISLPIVLSRMGILPALGLIGACAVVTYFSALVRAELNLQSHCAFTLEDVGLKFSGKIAALIGNVSLKLLQFSLLSAYIFGLNSLLSEKGVCSKGVVSTSILILLAFSSDKIINLNHKLFILLLTAIFISIFGMVLNTGFRLPSEESHPFLLSKIGIILPTLFTSFGFQGSLHSLTKFCNNDAKMIKTACFWGSLIPAITYTAWTLSVISLVFIAQPDLFYKMATDGIEIHELIEAICNVSGVESVKIITFIISVLAIVTSVVGVGIALAEDLERGFERAQMRLDKGFRRGVASIIAVLPATFVATVVPSAFVKVLSFAGMVLAVIAIFLPCFLFLKIKKAPKFNLLKRPSLIWFIIAFGVFVVLCELISLFD